MTVLITLAQLQKQWPHGNSTVPGLLEGIANSADAVFTKYSITTPFVVAMMFGQFSEETGGGVDMVENINYSPERACQVWPSRFSSVENVYQKVGSYPGDPQFASRLMDSVYGGRMGNAPPPSTDGWVFRGQGLSQCTGRDEYKALGEKVGTDLTSNPGWLVDPQHALECGIADFVLCGCLPFAEKDDVLGVTKKLNGGTNGLAAREQWLMRWKRELAA